MQVHQPTEEPGNWYVTMRRGEYQRGMGWIIKYKGCIVWVRSVSLLSVPMKFVLLFCLSLNTTESTSTTWRFTDVVRQETSFDLCRNQNIKFSNLHNLYYERCLTNSDRRLFHKGTRLAISPLLPIWYSSYMYVCSFLFYLYQMMLVNVKRDTCGKTG